MDIFQLIPFITQNSDVNQEIKTAFVDVYSFERKQLFKKKLRFYISFTQSQNELFPSYDEYHMNICGHYCFSFKKKNTSLQVLKAYKIAMIEEIMDTYYKYSLNHSSIYQFLVLYVIPDMKWYSFESYFPSTP